MNLLALRSERQDRNKCGLSHYDSSKYNPLESLVIITCHCQCCLTRDILANKLCPALSYSLSLSNQLTVKYCWKPRLIFIIVFSFKGTNYYNYNRVSFLQSPKSIGLVHLKIGILIYLVHIQLAYCPFGR